MKYIIAGVTFGVLLFIVILLSFLNKPTNTKSFQVKSLILASTQWLESSKKDTNRIAALMHVNYAMAFLHSARSLLSDDEIETILNISIEQFLQSIEQQQQKCLEEMKPIEEKAASKRFVFRPREK